MKALLGCEDSRALDDSTRKSLALSSLQLMEKASLRIWDALRAEIAKRPKLLEKGERLKIVAFCGKGDNGADALAILRHAFSAGFVDQKALISARELGENAALQAESLRRAGFPLMVWPDMDQVDSKGTKAIADTLEGTDILLDGVLGTGLSGRAKGEAESMILGLNEAKKRAPEILVVSIDLPSGLGDGWKEGFPCVAADLTLSLEPVKSACYHPSARHLCGQLMPVADVFPASLMRQYGSKLSLLEDKDLTGLLPKSDPSGYKMSRGRLAVFAGSTGAIGAAQLCAKAALSSGAGYVTLYVDEALYPLIAPTLESVIVKPWSAGDDIETCDAILVGPGWGRGKDRLNLLERLFRSKIPLVLDADALRLLSTDPKTALSCKTPRILTPHPGEFEVLLGSLGIPPDALAAGQAMVKVCEAYTSILVMKSHVTWICSPDGRSAVWDGMCPELGTAGSGDVLAGLVAGLSARNLALLKRRSPAARLGDREVAEALRDSALGAVIAHGRAGKNLAKTMGWFEASDIAAEASRILNAEGAGSR